MRNSDYTLLIVESSTLARQLQKLLPQNIYVIATDGYLWTPSFRSDKLRLGKKAAPEKTDIRKELLEESMKAVRIIIATDSDPAGDFIAWTLSKHLKQSALLRGNLQAISIDAATQLIHNTESIDDSNLYKRLENRFIIRELWSREYPGLDMTTAGATSLFGSPVKFRHYKSEKGDIYRTLKPVLSKYGTSIEHFHRVDETIYETVSALSTYCVLEQMSSAVDVLNFSDLQNRLNKLFVTSHPHTGEGLITYPRTDARSFFKRSWDDIRSQWIQRESLGNFIPPALQHCEPQGSAHDSIRPTDLKNDPEYIRKHIPEELASIYSVIYSQTLRAISMPMPAHSALKSNTIDAVFVSSVETELNRLRLQPVLTLSSFGHLLNGLGVIRPSRFGSYIDQARQENLIDISADQTVHPGKSLLEHMPNAEKYSTILYRLKAEADKPDMKPETITEILTS